MSGIEKLSKSLQCHVCFEEYKVNERIWQCRSGHSVCQRCRNHLDKCPFCKAPYEGTRNYAVEEIVGEIKINSISAHAAVADVLPSPPIASEYENIIPQADTRDILRPSTENDHTDSSSSSSPSIDSDEFRVVITVDQRYSNRWIKCTTNNIPTNAICGGQDHGGEPLYVGRAKHQGALIPGKVNRCYGRCYVPWGGEEHEKSNFEILHNIQGTWIPNSGGTIPAGAFAAGHTEDGETLYIGRANVEGTLSIGKVQSSHGCCYLSYGGTEYAKQDYEIFMLDR